MKIHKKFLLSLMVPAALYFLLLVPSLVGPIIDSDFFWHLASGRWIVEHRSLPSTDPFSYTSPAVPDLRTHFILTGYWLSQIIYYGFYALGGWDAIISLRFLLMGALMTFMTIGARKEERPFRVLLAGLASLVIVHLFPLDRPHVFSFVFYAIILHVMEKQTTRMREGLLPFPSRAGAAAFVLCMAAWGNAHAGYLVGQGTVLVYLLAEGSRLFRREARNKGRAGFKRLAVVGVLGIAAPLLNPNGYKALSVIGTYRMGYGLLDYQSTVSSFRTLPAIPVYWAFLAVSTAFVAYGLLQKRIALRHLILLLGIGYFSFTQVRYVPFFLIWAGTLIAYEISDWRLKWQRALSVLAIVVATAWLTITYREFDAQSLSRFAEGQRVGNYFPKDATDFLIANRIRGRMYNYYDWGGYLIWRFYPERSVFVDNRQLSENVYFQSLSISQAQKEPVISGKPFYRAALESLGIDHVVVPFFGVSGQILPLVTELTRDSEWAPVYLGANSVVFVKQVARYDDLIRTHAVDRRIFAGRFAQFIDFMIRQYPTHAHMILVSKGDLYASYGMVSEARDAYAEALTHEPENRATKEKLQKLLP